ncbi:hypothetical protein ACVWW6_000015 [Bradyrhizobium sp. USDA 3311]
MVIEEGLKFRTDAGEIAGVICFQLKRSDGAGPTNVRKARICLKRLNCVLLHGCEG